MFCKNNRQQTSLFDPINQMPKYLQDILSKSWAKAFNEYIFSKINEERFSVLYSDKASRPNSPINVIIGLLIIKEIFQQTDEELIGSIHFDIRYQYALNTTNYETQPVSINTLTNFRNKLVEYENSTGEDLIKAEVEALAESIAKYLDVDNKKVRVDSLMVSSSCRKLSRIELVYSVNIRLIKIINKINPVFIDEELKPYLEKGHKNDTIYRTRDLQADSKLSILINQSKLLYDISLKAGEIVTSTEEFQLLKRLIEDQTVEDGANNLVPKDSKNISSTSLQNPTDKDATYRKKYGDNIGYVVNIQESFNDENSVITGYDLKQNIHSDSKFADDVISNLVSKKNDSNCKLLVDGAYYEQEKAQNALKQGVEIIPSELVGRKASTDKLSYAKFIVDNEKNIISSCPNGVEPVESYYSSKSYTAKFNPDTCENCPLNSQCPKKASKKFNTIRFSEKAYNTATQRDKMKTHEYIENANKRAGIEGIPSVLRRRYKIDTMPIRGLLRSKLWVGFKIAAYNFKKLLKQVLESGIDYLFNVILVIFTVIINYFKFYFLEFEIVLAN
ncbi:transposase [Clostridium sp.]|uniref:transposase n=1 Tax=Clostridium sp. TaxID=1506 RepID=UPI002848F1DC|nr:transposase [Clostridium sp.]MDR3598357.1 transposase [Clostridium sp.]